MNGKDSSYKGPLYVATQRLFNETENWEKSSFYEGIPKQAIEILRREIKKVIQGQGD